MTVLCPVMTCIPNVTVAIFRDGRMLDGMVVENSNFETASFNLTVDRSLVGQYMCQVMGTFNNIDFISSEYFNITGKEVGFVFTVEPLY